MLFENFGALIYGFLIWWAILLAFSRFPSRYPKNNTWKKDIIITFVQSVILFAVFQGIQYFSS
ncbi:hypothetical protein ACQCU1_15970 [Sutcliffiella horikoshii]|uniref:Uncharacterized protein n=1 Tax=Sutcliffiella horikoshii TaxID=79883 RepID=A0AA94WQ89_9BACI|nr:hypothetical protein [Sutcliffiella horikoshii]TYS58491.1 hypothetical protein FZC74_11825 [Sutcliffiella horikoshii]